MKRARFRSVMFFCLAAVAGLLGAAMTGGYRDSAMQSLGPLRPVVVSTAPLLASKALTPGMAARRMRTVRVPERFLSVGAIEDPDRLVGLKPVGDLPAGTYLSYSLFRPPEQKTKRFPGLGKGRRPVELQVTGASALIGTPLPAVVDVVVTTENGSNGRQHTYVAAEAVPLLSLRRPTQDLPAGAASAILGLSRRQALDLIDAESGSRGIRLLPRARA